MGNYKKLDYDVGTFLNIVGICTDLHVLPYPGSLYDQDALFIHLYNIVAEAKARREELDYQKSNKSMNKAASRGSKRPRRSR